MAGTPIGVEAVRLSRLTADGTPAYGSAAGAFLFCAGISSFEYDFETEAGSSHFARDAAGNPCVNVRRQDDVKFVTFTLTMCRDDDRFTEIALADGATLVLDESDYPLGISIKGTRACGTRSTNYGVSIELWQAMYDCGVPADPPYKRIVLPRAYLTPSGSTMEDGPTLSVFKGFGVPNAAFTNGPFSDMDEYVDVVSSGLFLTRGEDSLPSCSTPLDYVAIPAHTS